MCRASPLLLRRHELAFWQPGSRLGVRVLYELNRPYLALAPARDPGSLRVGLSVARTRSSRSELPLRQPMPSTMSPKTGSLCLWISNR
jgi:hypothetical protein